MSYFQKILIANRGEIARRIIRTCKNLQIKTVAIYSEADKDAPYVREADEAYHIGESQVKKSYLNIEKILSVAKEANVDAIHPGYGFLSENSAFAFQCQKEGITFIGPDWKVIDLMGDKVKSRQEVQKVGIPIVPGWDGKLESIEEALEVAEKIGYPIMLKASAGGGGIGMQVVRNADEFKKIYPTVKQKAHSFFGNDSLFIERFIQNARHIEIQIIGDYYGNVLHLFERECSIQRRNQKVIEETPSPALSKEQKENLFKLVVKSVRELGYINAGTMEFIYDESTKEIFFLEMNTRLQVEHPITEEVTGIDLVEWQIKVAAKERITFKQTDILQMGHAIEARLYAEDPKTYFPSPGILKKLTLPQKEVRLDFGVEEGDVVSPYYDPMIGKIITHGANRKEAIEKLKKALETMIVEGITTNLSLLTDIITDDNFIKGIYTTSFLDQKKTLH